MIIEHIRESKVITEITEPKVITRLTITEESKEDVGGPKGWIIECHEDGSVIYKNPAASR